MPKSISAKEGDVLEITTEKGFAYVQYTHYHPECGELIRVLQGFYETPLTSEEIEVFTELEYRFSLFICWDYCVAQKGIHFTSNFPISSDGKNFPIFKKTDALIGQVWNEPNHVIWRLWDGKKEWGVGPLNEEQRKKHPEIILCSSEASLFYYIETGQSLGEDLY